MARHRPRNVTRPPLHRVYVPLLPRPRAAPVPAYTERHRSPLSLSSLGQVSDRIIGLRAGADDYLVKPFALGERPAVVTQAGLFAANGAAILRDVPAIPQGLDLTGRVQAVPAPGDTTLHWRAAGRPLADGRILVVARAADAILEVCSDLIRGAAIGIVPAILLSLVGGRSYRNRHGTAPAPHQLGRRTCHRGRTRGTTPKPCRRRGFI